MIPTLRRSRDDIFLIGEEQILAAQEPDPAPDPTIAIEAPGGRSSRRPRSPHLPGSLQGARGLALAGLGAGVLAVLAALELGGGSGPARRATTSSPRSPLISRSAARVPAAPATRTHARAARPAEVHRPAVVHHHRPRHPEARVRSRSQVIQSEPEREPTIPVAPVSSPVVTPTEPTPVSGLSAAAPAEPTSPGPPPSSSGGGPGGVESFGFER
ncbi:MAG TPA: hypothetical protein VHZ54_10340 [Solirubrobacterales bacterium]|nr:hypothetical protein [Solirubrobacterales bacterium]